MTKKPMEENCNIGHAFIAALMEQGYNVTVNHYGQHMDHCVTVEGAFFKVAGGFDKSFNIAAQKAVEQVRIKEAEFAAMH